MKEQILKLLRCGSYLLMITLIILAVGKGIFIQRSAGAIEASYEAETVLLNDKWEKSWKENREVMEYCYTIPEDAGDDLMLKIKTYVPKFGIYLDGVSLCRYSDEFGLNGGGRYMIRLPGDAAGKTLVLRIEKPGKGAGWYKVNEACLGSENAVWHKLLQENLYALFFGVSMFLFGLVLLIIVCYIGKSLTENGNKSILYLSIFDFLTGVWVVTDSELLLIVTDKIEVISMISFLSFMIMPAYLTKFINSIFGEKKSLVFLQRLFFVSAVLYLLNFLFPVIRGSWLLLPVHVGCVVGIGIILHAGYKKLKRNKDNGTQRIMRGFIVLSIFCVAAFIVYYVNPFYAYSVLYCIGIFLFVFYLLLAVLVRLYEQMEENANITAYKKLAYLDMMTGLLNRTAFMKEQQTKSSVSKLGYILMDINGLKQINDRYGHLEGDRQIISAAEYIKACFGEKGKCFRIGGDEFLVILENCTETEVAAAVDRMQKQVENENKIREIKLSVAVGYAVWRQECDTPEQLFRRADAGMYKNKQAKEEK